MGKMNDVSLKQKYLLWWEYFSRSGLYDRLYEKTISFFSETEEEKWEEWFDAVFEEKRKYKTISPFSFILFQELMEGESIDEWWENNYELSKQRNRKVLDVTEKAEGFRNLFCSSSIKRLPNDTEGKVTYIDTYGKEKTYDLREFGKMLAKPISGDLIIHISGLFFWKYKELEKEIKKIIKNRERELKPRFGLSGKLQYSKLVHYLDVYDRVELFKGKHFTWKKITKDFYPGLAKRLKDKDLPFKEGDRILNKLENHERLLKMEYAKAKRIIANTERGIFPGRY